MTKRMMFAVIVGAATMGSCSSTGERSGPVTTASGLSYEVVSDGSGPVAARGQTVRIHETTMLADGTLVYSTRTGGKPVKFTLGAKQAIDGLDEAVTGMRVGERRKAIIPPALSKRSSYPPNTPPDATLYYDIELVEIVAK